MNRILTEEEKQKLRVDKGPILIGVPKNQELSLEDILHIEMEKQAEKVFSAIAAVASSSIEEEDKRYARLYLKFNGVENIRVSLSNEGKYNNREAFISYRFRNELRDMNSEIYVAISEDLEKVYGGLDYTPFKVHTMSAYLKRIIALLPLLYYDKETTRTFENLTEEERIKALKAKFKSMVEEAKKQNTEVISIPPVEATLDWWSMFIDSKKSTPEQIERFRKELRSSLIAELSKEGEAYLRVDADDHKNANIIEQAIINAGLDFADFPQWRVRTIINCDYVVEGHTDTVIYDSSQITKDDSKLTK